VQKREALGGPSSSSHHPSHYLRLRAAVEDMLAKPRSAPEALEIAMFLRGRDHFFLLRPTPLRAPDGPRWG